MYMSLSDSCQGFKDLVHTFHFVFPVPKNLIRYVTQVCVPREALLTLIHVFVKIP